MDIILYKTAKFYVLNQSRSILLVLTKYTFDVITQSRDLGGWFLVC